MNRPQHPTPMKRRLTILAALVRVVAASTLLLPDTVRAATSNPEPVEAVWAAQKDLGSKFAVEDGSLLFDLPGADYRRLAVDRVRSRVWALGKDGLSSYTFDGSMDFLLTHII